MKFVLQNITEQDAEEIFLHLYKRQVGLFVKDDKQYLYVDLDRPSDITFLGMMLKCEFLFKPLRFEHSFGHRYNILEIVRDKNEDTDSGDGVLHKE